MDKKLFAELNLSPEMLDAVRRMGFEAAMPIQSESIPPLLEGRDMVGQSQTGSGKTAAFGIPAIERVDPKLNKTQALILCPTRELAIQVAEEIAKLTRGKPGVRELPIYGGQAYDRQFRGLKKGAHIVIGTPGRVLDHLEKGSLVLDELKTVILDEADRMLDMGFMDEILAILSKMPPTRQTVLFSATVPPPIKHLIKQFTRDPVWVKIEARELTAPDIEQVWYEVDRRSKLEVLCRLIDYEDVRFAIVFCATKKMVDELVEHLAARGYLADKLHGDMTQPMRERVMNRFRKRNIEFLVATDVAARGLDVKEIEVVYNYDLPNDGEDYVHRIGRTGRAGSSGKAVTLVAGRELYKLQNIVRFTKAKIKRARIPSVDQLMEQRAHVFFEALKTMLEEKDFHSHDELVDRLLDQGHTPTEIISALMEMMERATGKPAPEEIPEPCNAPRKGKKAAGRPDAPGGKKKGKTKHPDLGPTRKLVLSVGRQQNIKPGDVLGVILGAAQIDRGQVGYIKLRNNQTEVDVAEGVADQVTKKLGGIKFKGYRLKVNVE